jgi:hypothetical protein
MKLKGSQINTHTAKGNKGMKTNTMNTIEKEDTDDVVYKELLSS